MLVMTYTPLSFDPLELNYGIDRQESDQNRKAGAGLTKRLVGLYKAGYLVTELDRDVARWERN